MLQHVGGPPARSTSREEAMRAAAQMRATVLQPAAWAAAALAAASPVPAPVPAPASVPVSAATSPAAAARAPAIAAPGAPQRRHRVSKRTRSGARLQPAAWAAGA
eukprot:COSAG05_NODE_4360_length_1550_cov_2.140593_1_plen_105_part_00